MLVVLLHEDQVFAVGAPMDGDRAMGVDVAAEAVDLGAGLEFVQQIAGRGIVE